MLLRGANHHRYERLARWFISAVFAITQTAALVFFSYTAIRGFEPAPSRAAAGIPLILNYQGKLTNAAGVTVSDGDQSMVIVIYDAATGGNCLYAMRGTCASPTAETVTVTSGIFTIQVGDSSDNTLSLNFNDDSYYLGIKVSTDSEMTPRKRITAAGYAINSDRLDGYSASVTAGANAIPATDNSGNLIITTRVYFGTSTTSTTSGRVYVDTASSSQSGLLIRGAVSQSANLAVFQNDVASTIGWVSASGGFGASGTSLMRTINADTNNTYDLGTFGNVWRSIFASTSVNVSNGAASTTLGSGNLSITGNLLVASVNTSDLGSMGIAFRNLFASTSVNVSSGAGSSTISGNGNITLSGHVLPSSNNASDLGAFGTAFRDIYASTSLRVGTSSAASSTLSSGNLSITGSLLSAAVNSSDLGSMGIAFRNLFASTSLNVSSGATSATLSGNGNLTLGGATGGGIFVATNNALDLGESARSFRDLYSSGTLYIGTSILPRANNTVDFGGAAGTSLRDIYSSGTIYLGTSLIPRANNVVDLGSTSSALRDIYVSGTLRLGTGGAVSTTLASNGNLNLTGGIFASGTINIGTSGAQTSTSSFYHGVTLATQGGNVGIGTAVPGALLNIFRRSGGTANIFRINGSSGNTMLNFYGAGDPILDILESGGTTSSRITSDGTSWVGGNGGGGFSVATTTALSTLNVSTVGNDQALMLTANSTQTANIFEYWNSLGSPGGSMLAWISSSGGLGASGTSLMRTINADTNNSYDLGTFGNVWRSIFASTSINVSSGATSATLSGNGNLTLGGATGGGIFVATNNALDLGAFGSAWRDIHTSGTARFGSSTNGMIIGNPAGNTAFIALASDNSAKRLITHNQSTSSTLNFVEIADILGRPIFWVNQSGGVGSSATFFMGPGVTNAEALTATSTVNSNLFVRGNIQGNGDISVAGNCRETDGACADVAELYPSEEPVEPGDVLSVSENSGINGNPLVKKSNKALTSNIVGIVSTNPGITLGVNGIHIGKRAGNELEPLVALAGRVPAKVTIEGGEIKPGDLLVSASTSGHAMKYDPSMVNYDGASTTPAILGVALESFNQDVPGKILVLVRSGFVSKSSPFADKSSNELNIGINHGDIVYKDIDLGGKSIINAKSIKSISNVWEITEDGWIIAKEIKTEKVTIKNTQNKKTIDIIKIPANTKRYTVFNPTIEKTSRAFLTLRSEPVDVIWAVRTVKDGSFEIVLSHEVDSELEFDYWIVGVEEELENNATQPVARTEVTVENTTEAGTNSTEHEDEVSEIPNEPVVVEDGISGDAEDTTDHGQANELPEEDVR